MIDGEDLSAEASEQLAERLYELVADPLDVNTATAAELSQLPHLSLLLAERVVAYRAAHGPFDSLHALVAVDGLGPERLASLHPYLTAASPVEADRYPGVPRLGEVVRGLRLDLIHRFTRRLDLGRGYEAPRPQRVTPEGDTLFSTVYRGSPERLYTRLQARYGRQVRLNLTMDKDPGEPFRWRPDESAYGYDYVSAHAAVQSAGRLRALVVGDYVATFGQGVLLWRGSAFGKGRDAVGTVVRRGRGIVPYGSADENRFFRGLAATVRVTPSLDLSAFASRRTLDATVIADTVAPAAFEHAATLGTTGLHRTASELDRKDALTTALYGGAVTHDGRSFSVGAAAYHARFDPPLRPDTAAAYRRYDLTGSRATAASLFGQYRARGLLLAGEVARGAQGHVGGIATLSVQAGPHAEAVVVARSFPAAFVSPHGHPFGERAGAAQNEHGLYLGVRVRPAARWAVAAYVDQYRFPWVRYGVPRPSSGYEARAVVELTPRPWLHSYVELRTESREAGAVVTNAAGRVLEGVATETRQSARLHGDYVFSDRLRLRSRLEATRYVYDEAPPEHGVLLQQDVRWQAHARVQVDARLALFETDGYGARVYSYENDLLYTFSVPAFSGVGQRAYLLLRLRPMERLTIEGKYGATQYRRVQTVGSGLDEVEGTRLREVRLQLRLRL